MSVHHRTPLDHEIRERILSVKDERKRFGFMAQYLWLGRVSEVFGKYMPDKTCYRLTEFDGEEAVMFIVKTAKRKGRLRPVALPLNPEYEPWAKLVYEYIANNDQEYPFALHENVETSKKYAMTAARKMFQGLWWPMIDYSRASAVPYTENMVLAKQYNKKGLDEYLVEFPDGSRVWTTDKETANITVKVEPRWKPATSHVDRKRRTLTLAMNYLFDGIDLATAGGWTSKSQDETIPQAVKHYLWLDLSEINESVIEQLKNMASRHFKKLLIPYSPLI